MATEIPTFVTHYHLTDKPPFLNLSDLADPELSVVIQELQQRRASSGLKRVFGPSYMPLRRLTETRLYDLFVRAGGTPERSHAARVRSSITASRSERKVCSADSA